MFQNASILNHLISESIFYDALNKTTIYGFVDLKYYLQLSFTTTCIDEKFVRSAKIRILAEFKKRYSWNF